MNKLMRLRKNKKGFTLVELLVVLVIIAILMAAIIPSMLGFIDKAREEAVSAECRNVQLAARTILNEDYGTGATEVPAPATYAINVTDVAELADTSGTIGAITIARTTATATVPSRPYISAITYTASNGIVYSYTATNTNDGTWARQ